MLAPNISWTKDTGCLVLNVVKHAGICTDIGHGSIGRFVNNYEPLKVYNMPRTEMQQNIFHRRAEITQASRHCMRFSNKRSWRTPMV